MLIYENKVPASYRTAFIAKVILVSKNLGIDPNWLMAIMHFESAGTFSPSITNSLGYTGLIQFGNSAATSLGTTTAALRNMTAVQQLSYVEKYYKMWFKTLKITVPDSFVDTYLITFFPAAVNKGLDFIIHSKRISAESLAKSNPIFDLDKNKQITVAEIQEVMLKRLPSEWIKDFLKKKAVA
jgi:hypothetical protein